MRKLYRPKIRTDPVKCYLVAYFYSSILKMRAYRCALFFYAKPSYIHRHQPATLPCTINLEYHYAK